MRLPSVFRLLPTAFKVLAVVFCLAAAGPARAQLPAPGMGAAAGRMPPLLRQAGIEQRLNQQVPLDLAFRDERGRAVRLGDYFASKPVILSFAYYRCPMLCPQVLEGLARSLGVLPFDAGSEFEVLTVSFDPSDTPELAAGRQRQLLPSGRRREAAAGWHFLTGDERSIRALTEAVGYRYSFDPESGQFAHGTGIMVLTPGGRVARYFYGIEYAPKDLRLGLLEASEEKIGSPVDQILLFCYRYDPATGKYSAAVLNIVKLGAALTLLALLALLAALRRSSAGRDRITRGELT
ncbi:MAG: SCO family protein [Acidobacteria bacterium]|nr:SCO family protein [Acidobacteriota bacterium]